MSFYTAPQTGQVLRRTNQRFATTTRPGAWPCTPRGSCASPLTSGTTAF